DCVATVEPPAPALEIRRTTWARYTGSTASSHKEIPGSRLDSTAQCRSQRQRDADRRAAAGAGSDLNPAAMSLNDPPNNRQTQTTSFSPGGFERGSESPPALFPGHAVTGVFELDHNLAGLAAAFQRRCGAGNDGQFAPVRHGLNRIEDEIKKGLLQLRGVRHDGWQTGFELVNRTDVLLCE